MRCPNQELRLGLDDMKAQLEALAGVPTSQAANLDKFRRPTVRLQQLQGSKAEYDGCSILTRFTQTQF